MQHYKYIMGSNCEIYPDELMLALLVLYNWTLSSGQVLQVLQALQVLQVHKFYKFYKSYKFYKFYK